MRKFSFFLCDNCGNKEKSEREVICWECGKGEMVYVARFSILYRVVLHATFLWYNLTTPKNQDSNPSKLQRWLIDRI